MSPLATINDLPVELHETILDVLVSDLETLRACCLTCKLWLPRAQHNLHHQVMINPKNRSTFCETVVHRPQLVSSIRELTLHGIERLPKPPHSLRPSGIQLLRIVDMDMLNPWLDAVVAGCSSSVKQLSLRECSAEDTIAFMEHLQRMPKLQHIEVENGYLRSQDQDHVLKVDFPELLSLSLVGGERHILSLVPITRAFIACPEVYKKLCILKIRLPYGCADAFARFLDVVGHGLREVDLGMIPDTGFQLTQLRGESPFSLTSCPNLLLLTLEVRIGSSLARPVFVEWVPDVLVTVCAPKLRRVKFVVKAQQATRVELERLDLVRIARILNEERFASVRVVLFQVVGGFLLKDVLWLTIFTSMAELDARGILKYSAKPERCDV